MDQNQTNDTSDWVSTPAAPWRRYFARAFDTISLGFLGFFMLAYVGYSVTPAIADAFFSNLNPLVDMILTALMGFTLSGLLLGLIGTTPGKAIFGIRVRNPDGQNLGVTSGLTRDLSAYIKGAALGIPLVLLVPMIMAFNKLKKDGTTSWDQNKYVVTYRKSSWKQTLLNIVGVVMYLILISVIKSLST